MIEHSTNKYNDTYWDRVFNTLSAHLRQQKSILPSVSQVALEKPDPYRILISTIISLRTKDEVTLAASKRLFSLASSPEEMVELSADHIAQTIHPAGFFRNKSRTILEVSRILISQYAGKVPSNVESLLSLPGVGLKTANLTLNLGFGIEAICVDTHVHRISNRLGWVSTTTAEKTEHALKTLMPRRHWIGLNELLVSFGQITCRPTSPFCSVCPMQAECPRIGVKTSR